MQIASVVPCGRMRPPVGSPVRWFDRLLARVPRPDWLATPRGRLAAFFLLYVSEGIPHGFTVTAIATQMRRQGVGPAEIGLFVGALYLPWGFKFLAGPIVDTFGSERFGRYRLWIVLMQVGLVLSLLAALPVNFAAEIRLFTILLLLHNSFAATQDVAIDALAVNVLPEGERGAANGFMWAGYAVGQALGGAGVLYLSQVLPFRSTYVFVAAILALITLTVSLPLREPPRPRPQGSGGNALASAGRQILGFTRDAARAFVSSRGALVGVGLSLLPLGAYALGLALQSNVAVELGMSDGEIATLALASQIVTAIACIAGGWLSDRFGRRKILALAIACMSVPTLWLAWSMQTAGVIHPLDPQAIAGSRATAAPGLVATFFGLVLLYQFFNGVMYAVSIALYMDVTTPRVAATQFTAYMAVCNLCTSYSAAWQGLSIARLGYPVTLLIDGLIGLLAIGLLPFMTRTPLRAGRRVAPPQPGAAIPEAFL